MKRLRKSQEPKIIRYYHCGEYGDKNGRPHYHACLFNHDFDDKKLWQVTDTGQRLFTSKKLQQLWPYGYSTIGSVTFLSAAYVARYILKKVSGESASKYYEWIDPSTGEIHSIEPEYTTMSLKPGIGKAWFEKYHSDVYPDDFVVMNGKKMTPPKYYDGQYEHEFPTEYKKIKRERMSALNEHKENCTKDRLAVRETVQLKKLEQLKRTL